VNVRIVIVTAAITSAVNRPRQGLRDRKSNESALEILEFIF
jgi:hypothetical protein